MTHYFFFEEKRIGNGYIPWGIREEKMKANTIVTIF